MRKILSLSAFCILINVTVFGQGTATVSGRVTVGSQPAVGVEVMLTSSDPSVIVSNQSVTLTAMTDSDGHYVVSGVPAGNYRITAYAPAFVAKTETSENWLGRMLSVTEGESIEKVDFTLTHGAVITGRVTDSSGRGLIEEMVSLITVDAEGKRTMGSVNQRTMVLTDDRGIYRAFGLPAGRYRVAAGPEQGNARARILRGGRYTRTWHPDATDESAAKIVTVEAGDEAEKVDIIMVPADKREVYSASGRVIDAETGAPVAGAMILHSQLVEDRSQGAVMNSTASNSRGEFKIDSITSGTYEVIATFLQGGDSYCDPVRFEVSGGDVSGLEIRMMRGGSISGMIVVEGGAPPDVMASLSKIELYATPLRSVRMRGFTGRAQVIAGGSFSIHGLPPGKYSLSLTPYFTPKGLTLIRAERNGSDGREIDLQAGENVTGVRLVVRYGSGIISGRVEVRNGVLPPGSKLYVIASRFGDTGSANNSVWVDNRGFFILEGLVTGNYMLRLYAQVPTASQQDRMFSTEQQVSVTGTGRQQITIVLDLSREGKEDE